MKSFYRFVLVTFVVSLLVLAGCESLENFSAKWSDSTAKTVQTVGNVAAPFTGGISSLVAGIAVTVLPTVFAVNRQLLKWKSDKAAAEAQASAANIVQKIETAKISGPNPGVVDFNDPATLAILNTMTDAAKSLVDSAQGKAS